MRPSSVENVCLQYVLNHVHDVQYSRIEDLDFTNANNEINVHSLIVNLFVPRILPWAGWALIPLPYTIEPIVEQLRWIINALHLMFNMTCTLTA